MQCYRELSACHRPALEAPKPRKDVLAIPNEHWPQALGRDWTNIRCLLPTVKTVGSRPPQPTNQQPTNQGLRCHDSGSGRNKKPKVWVSQLRFSNQCPKPSNHVKPPGFQHPRPGWAFQLLYHYATTTSPNTPSSAPVQSTYAAANHRTAGASSTQG